VRTNTFDRTERHGGSIYSGAVASPQQFYQFFEPDALPDRSDPSTSASAVDGFIAGLDEPYVRGLDFDIYWRPNKAWHHPGHAGGRNRGIPGKASKIEFGAVTSEIVSGDVLTGITWDTADPHYAETAHSPRVAFQVTNMNGYTVNRDYVHLMGLHPDDPYSDPYSSRHALVSSSVLNMRLHPLADTARGGSISTLGTAKSVLYGSDAPVAKGAIAGQPLNPSADNDPSSGILQGTVLPAIGSSVDVTDRPTKVELAFVVHTIDRRIDDEFDHDGDGDTGEMLALAVWHRVLDDHPGLDPEVPADAIELDEHLIEELETINEVGVAFRHAILLPH